ncbi:hypothetical protein FA15DRAFT_672655 [Coprinopsis marcescibilis]|uniref:F-box domain-containing protein n=1 Tax=Coprinopsis marcescibilis TaxID=230819 RepID=A0A5C3KN45_COPMA|nr:hypothetical protein FA15DRAFT_672655 [Coprinopsis marcescibilis]
MVADLPAELLREILKYIRGSSWDIPSNSKKHLKITSLVSPIFREISQEFLFEKLEVGPMPRIPQLGKDICLGTKLLSLFTLSPKLATHVKYIDLNDTYAPCVEITGNISSMLWLDIDHDIPQALRRIPLQKIVAFRFRSLSDSWDLLPGETQDVILSICSSPCLKSLEVEAAFLGILDACGSLKELKVNWPNYNHLISTVVVPEERQRTNKLTLERLEMNFVRCSLKAIHPIVLDPSNRIETSRLKSLTISASVRSYDFTVIGGLLRSCTSSLEKFIYRGKSFGLRWNDICVHDPQQFGLSKLSALKRFACIYTNHGDTTSRQETALSSLLPLFHTLPSLSPLEVFHLYPWYDERVTLEQMANLAALWDQFDALFADRPRFQRLRCVRINVSYISRDGASDEDDERYVESIRQKIKSHLKRLMRAGILAVDVSLGYSACHFGWPSAPGLEFD